MEKFIRPQAMILSDEANVPTDNLISPPPNQFTHRLSKAQPHYFYGAQQAMPPNGEFPAETKVVLMVFDGGNYCRVIDERGLYAETEYAGLEKL